MPEQPFYTSRREFLAESLTFLSAASTLPLFLGRTAGVLADPEPASPNKGDSGHILVVVQLAGGNDGLNTVVPYERDPYYKHRRRLAIRKKDAFKLEDGLGLHPAATGLKELFDDGKLAIVQGVGYPDPNRSHFTSMDIWHNADPELGMHDGWLGRYFDATCGGAEPGPEPILGIALMKEAPQAMQGDRFTPLSFENSDALTWRAGRRRGFGGGGQLGRSLELVARLIAADLPTRVYYVANCGFDTHTNQQGRHRQLMREFGSAMKGFIDVLSEDRLLDRVLVMTFSEFGRRVQENARGGTDHGAAAPMFLFGSKVRPGIHLEHPSLSELHRGDLAFGCDFRRVYASVLRDWLNTRPSQVLGGNFAPLRLIKA